MSSSSSKLAPLRPAVPAAPLLRRVAVVALVSVVALVALACDDPAKPPPEDNKVKAVLSGGCRAEATQTLKGFQSQTKITVKGGDRTYDWLVPDAHDGRHPVPVVFVYHADGGSGAEVRAAFKLEDAVAGKAIMVYPDANLPSKKWDLDRGGQANADIFFFDEVLKSLSDTYCIDTNRVFVTGISSGAYFANLLACIRGGSIRAVASHGGGGPKSDEYSSTGELECPEKPVAAIITHGSDDEEVPVSEAQATRDHWSKVNSCRPGGLEVFDPAPCISQLGCAADRPVVYCEVPGIGHTIWSEAPKATWNFFSEL